VGFGKHQVGLGGLLGWINGFWVFLSFLGVILFLFGVFLYCVLGSPLGFCWVLVSRKYKWEWILGFGEDQVNFVKFSWEFLSFFCFFSLFSCCLGVFDVFWGLRWVLVGFMFVIMVKKSKLWDLENIG